MPDVGGRLDKVEQGLTKISQQMDEQFAHVDERFVQIDQRFAQVDQRFNQVDDRFNQLQILVEENTSHIKLVAEVLAHHGTVLDQIKESLEPLKTLQPLFEKVAKDHEQRITALERARS